MSLIQFTNTLDVDTMHDGMCMINHAGPSVLIRRTDFFERMCEAFVQQFCVIVLGPANYFEDLFYALQAFRDQYLTDSVPGDGLPLLADRKAFDSHLLSEMFRVLGVPIDQSTASQPDQAFKNPFLQRVLNVQVMLGYSGLSFSRSLSASIAWTVLNLRYCTMAFTLAANKNPKPPAGMLDTELKNPGANFGPLKTLMSTVC